MSSEIYRKYKIVIYLMIYDIMKNIISRNSVKLHQYEN